MFSQIGIEAANEAYAEAVSKLNKYRIAARITRQLSGALDGVFVNIRLEKRIADMFPDYRVHYFKASYGAKYITFYSAEYRRTIAEIRIADKDQKRISASDLNKQAEFYEKQIREYSTAIDGFFEYLGQYNSLVASLDDVRNKISTVMYCHKYFRF